MTKNFDRKESVSFHRLAISYKSNVIGKPYCRCTFIEYFETGGDMANLIMEQLKAGFTIFFQNIDEAFISVRNRL